MSSYIVMPPMTVLMERLPHVVKYYDTKQCYYWCKIFDSDRSAVKIFL